MRNNIAKEKISEAKEHSAYIEANSGAVKFKFGCNLMTVSEGFAVTSKFSLHFPLV